MARKFYEEELRQIARNSKGLFEKSGEILYKSAVYEFSTQQKFDIFLSHSFQDAEVIHGLKLFIESTFNLSVYVDWIDDPLLDRSKVTRNTADRLRLQMNNSRTLLVAYSEALPTSRWVPWEIGYFDSNNGKIATIPITKDISYSEEFQGQEYLGLYSYGVRGKNKRGDEAIWIQNSPDEYVPLTEWVNGTEPYVRGA